MPSEQPTTSRLEAFSDGVIAVIITIMVLELKVPRANGLEGLRAVLPTLLIYALSFAFTGIYWINHHHLVHRIETVDQRILYSNLLFLFCLSLLPFFTGYVLEKHIDSFSVAIYAVSLIASGAAFFLLRLAIGRQLVRSNALDPEDRLTMRKHLLSLALYTVAIPLAFFHPLLAMLVVAGITLVWVLPTFGVEHLSPHPTLRRETEPDPSQPHI